MGLGHGTRSLRACVPALATLQDSGEALTDVGLLMEGSRTWPQMWGTRETTVY